MSLIDLIGTAGPAAHLAARPRTGVAHVTTGPLTPSGRFAAVPCRTVCRAHNRRLQVLPERFASLSTSSPVPVRLCALCLAGLARLSAASPAMAQLNTDDVASRWAGTTIAELVTALAAATSSDETYRIGRLALILFGPPVIRTGRNRDHLTREQHDLVDFTTALHKVRSHLTSAERTPEQRAADIARQAEDAEFALDAIRARRRADWQANQREKAARRGIATQPPPPTSSRRRTPARAH